MNCGSLFSVNKKITNLYNKCKLSVYILYEKVIIGLNFKLMKIFIFCV